MKQNSFLSGLALIITSLMACQSSDDSNYPEIFLIPSSSEGMLRIVFDEKCGIKPREENGQQTVKFGSNGFLILSGDLNHGKKNEFYLVDPEGKKTKVDVIEKFRDRNGMTPSIVTGGVGVTFLASLANSKSVNRKGIAFQDFYLYNKGTIEIVEERSPVRTDSLTNIAVNECRMNN